MTSTTPSNASRSGASAPSSASVVTAGMLTAVTLRETQLGGSASTWKTAPTGSWITA